MKFDPDGNIIWARKDSISVQPDPELQDQDSRSFCILPNNGFASAGIYGWNEGYVLLRNENGVKTNEFLFEDMNYKAMTLAHNDSGLILVGSNDGTILHKIDFDGNTIWEYNYFSYNSTSPVAIIQTNDGGYAVLSFSYIGSKSLLLKVDAEGSVQWVKEYQYLDYYTSPRTIIQTSDNGFLISNEADNPDIENSMGGFIVKTNSNGDSTWTKKFQIEYLGNLFSALEIGDEYILFGINNNCGNIVIAKLDSETKEEISYSELGDLGYTSSQQPFQQSDTGFIGFIKQHYRFVLFKSDENGIITNNEDINIVSDNIITNYPNPFSSISTNRNNGTNICFSITSNSNIELVIYNVKGQKIKTLVNNLYKAGEHTIFWNGKNNHNKPVTSGVYFACLRQNNKVVAVKKCMIIN
jgi:hypothetical protein